MSDWLVSEWRLNHPAHGRFDVELHGTGWIVFRHWTGADGEHQCKMVGDIKPTAADAKYAVVILIDELDAQLERGDAE